MPNREIEEFAAILIRQIRDVAIQNCDGLLQSNANSPPAKRWKNSIERGAALEEFIPDTVDETIFCLLQAIDQGLLHLKFVDSTGREVDLNQEGVGELSGWYMGSGGWRAMYSEERFIDDFADLAVYPATTSDAKK